MKLKTIVRTAVTCSLLISASTIAGAAELRDPAAENWCGYWEKLENLLTKGRFACN